MVITDVHIANIDFENYGTPDSDLQGQGTAPFLWAVTNSVGATPAFNARINTDDQGGASGITMQRRTSNPNGSQNRAVAVLQSGLPPLSATITKHTFQADFVVDQNGSNPSKNDIFLRPSGVNYDSGFYGWRAGIWVRASPETNDRIVLQRLVASANGEVHTHFIPKSAYSGRVTLRATDDGTTIEVYANISGTFELIHSVASTVYNDHTPSGAIAFSRDGGTQNTLVDNFIIMAEQDVLPPSPETTRGLGEQSYTRNYTSIRSTRRSRSVQLF